MVIIKNEFVKPGILGTIIDFETIGKFDNRYYGTDIRHYRQLRPTIFGFLSGNNLIQYCAEGQNDIPRIIKKMNEILPSLDPPFYALNCNFERGVCTYSCDCVPEPLYDVRGDNSFERKWDIRERLGISTYDDPFNGKGDLCLLEWKKSNYPDCLLHNRACLLIERDILYRTNV